jgi:hypothetical protein
MTAERDRTHDFVARARWLAFIPAVWFGALCHQAVVRGFGVPGDILATFPPPEVIRRAELIFGAAAAVTVIATMLLAILLGPPRRPLFQVFAVAVVYAAVCTFDLTHLGRAAPPALLHAGIVDLSVSIALSLAVLCGVAVMTRKKAG